jgi:hypothetical protein
MTKTDLYFTLLLVWVGLCALITLAWVAVVHLYRWRHRS